MTRDFVGYGEHPPHASWPGGARVAISFVLNYEEGGERSILDGDAITETNLHEIVGWPPVEARLLNIDQGMLNRAVNEGFSGGEKKRNEIFQMALLEPKLAILDETDSGLDIDALKVVADGVNALRSPERAIIVVTHYQRLLNYIVPDRVHVLLDGRIARSGGPELALELEASGYGAFGHVAAQAVA